MKINNYFVLSIITYLFITSNSYAVTNEQGKNNQQNIQNSSKQTTMKQNGDKEISGTSVPDSKKINNNYSVVNPEKDKQITKSIEDYIKRTHALSNQKVEVSTHQGVVTLKGTVDSDSIATLITEWSQATHGVSDVVTENLDVVDGKSPLSDMYTTAKVKGSLMREKAFGTKDIGDNDINVETHNGIVYLTGVVDSDAQAKNAVKIAGSVEGVNKVIYQFYRREFR